MAGEEQLLEQVEGAGRTLEHEHEHEEPGSPGLEFSELELFADDADIERASRSLKAMSHPLRLKILCTLGDEEVSVQDIVDHVGTSQSNISQHLAILRDKGILAARKDANRVYYRVGDSRTLRLIGMMREVFCSRTP
ncbi:ArsR/SmtB family transcription factor [Halochromatium sp.]